MNHLDVFNFLKARLAPVAIPANALSASSPDEEPQIHVDPIECRTFRELHAHYFPPQTNGKVEGAEWTWDIEATLATSLAVVLSTDTTGGQLGCRVIGTPGSFKSTLAESLSVCRELIYPRSKFTGFVSGWASIRKSQITANKANGKCIVIKDADTMLQLANLSQIESEIRDAMGDGVIRADYRTGREFEIYTHFSMIMCGTLVLKRMDSSELGSRFVDIFIQRPGANTKKIVMHAIKSQSQQICSQISERRKSSNNESNPTPIMTDRLKAIIRKLGAPSYGFLLWKREQLRKGMEILPLSPLQEDRVYAMGELVANMRTKAKRGFDKELTQRPEKENATRISEQFTRLLHYLSIVFQEGDNPAIVTDREFRIADKILRDTIWGFELEVLEHVYKEQLGSTTLDIAEKCGIGQTKAFELCKNLCDTGVLAIRQVPNIHGKGQRLNLYVTSEEIRQLCERARFNERNGTNS